VEDRKNLMIPDFTVGPFILMYHSIGDYPDDVFAVSVDAFREQMTWLSENGFEVVSLSFLLRSMQTGNYRALRKKVVITFDDGYQDFVTNALPILQEYGATATVFLVTSMLGWKASWNEFGPQVALMSEDEVRYIIAQGISIGSHTATHVRLTLQDHVEVQRQLRESYDTLIRLGESFPTISYPWGQYSNQIEKAAKDTGFECAVAVGEQTRFTVVNRYRLPRITIVNDMYIKRFLSLMTRSRIEIEIRRICWAVREKIFGTSKVENSFGNRSEVTTDYGSHAAK
jgi:peptidoglycan/xylan/chitin deacetylase (PgdA/CDA1 family)